ncbi:HAMP domain-containing sensor histidine kinase [Pseudacidovorax intermedius]|uniref:sensor histidine kinase n=1 Tax=Pseudacidovorax intermedius TaxID=433924 RepID=UPI0026F02FCE|nr:HAMP domain-containing sensor histidine kinase [Pseudacidovorax intermedius]
MRSLRLQLAVFWALLIAICLLLGVVLLGLYRLSPAMQLKMGHARVEQACGQLAQRYTQSAPPAPDLQADLARVLLQLVLTEAPYVEGGIWSRDGGMVGYAYPTYEGAGVKTDVPPAERPLLEQLARQAVDTGRDQAQQVRGSRELLIVAACPLNAGGAAAWTMTRTQLGAVAAEGGLRAGVAALVAAIVFSGLWLGLLLYRGQARLRRLELALAAAPADAMPVLPRTGLEELDRIVASYNGFAGRFEEARAVARDAQAQRSRDMRLAALGRMSSAVAHEIRNPIAAMRLKAENALAGDAPAQGRALQTIVGQIDRLDAVVQSLLALVQPLELKPQPVDLPAWLDERLAAAMPGAAARQVRLVRAEGAPACAVFDPMHLARAIDNLLDNAVRHARSPGGQVRLAAHGDAGLGQLTIAVSDDGEGVPEALRSRLFEPFGTGRADGTGLGLALSREVAFAHGGELRHEPGAPGARFILEMPWQTC